MLLNFQLVLLTFQLVTRNSCFTISLKKRSIQDNELDNRWVGSDISCCSPCIVVNGSVTAQDVTNVMGCYVIWPPKYWRYSQFNGQLVYVNSQIILSYNKLTFRHIAEISILILQLTLVDLFTFTRSYLIVFLDPFLISQKDKWGCAEFR